MHRPCLNEEGGEQSTKKTPNLSLRPLQVYTDIHIDAHANHQLRVPPPHIKLKRNVSKYFFKVGDLGREGRTLEGIFPGRRVKSRVALYKDSHCFLYIIPCGPPTPPEPQTNTHTHTLIHTRVCTHTGAHTSYF